MTGAPRAAHAASRRPRAGPSPRLVRSVVVVVVTGLVLWAGSVTVRVLAATHDDQRGLAAVNLARRQLSSSDLLTARPLRPLVVAQADFGHAHRLLGSAWLAPARVLPVVGRQLRAAKDLSATAGLVSQVGAEAISGASAALHQGYRDGPQRVAVLQALSTVAGRADRRLARLNYGPSDGLIAPVARRRAKLVEEVAKVRGELAKTAVVTAVVGRQLAAGAHYLVLAANNAEMRSGSGMFLEASVLTIDNGSLKMGPTMPTPELPTPPVPVPIGGDLAARWGWLHPNQEWRNLATTPQFDVTAALAARMWQAATGQAVDGVLALDDVALQAVLAATGPVSVGPTTIGEDNAVSFLTKTQYLQSDQTARREMLGALTRAAVAAVDQGHVSIAGLGAGLAGATAGRHVMLWSADPAVQAAYRSSGAAGLTEAQDLMVGVLNGGGNKLDPYLGVQVHLTLTPSAQATRVVITIDLDNQAPAGLPSYVTGSAADIGVEPGGYAGLLVADLPGAARDARVAGYPTLVAAGSEGPQVVVAAPFRLLPGQKRQMLVTFELPGRHGRLLVLPSARVPAVGWQAPNAAFSDTRPRQLSY